MKREKLEKYLGKKVTIRLFDGSEYTGELHKTGEERFKYNSSLYYPRNLYMILKGPNILTSPLFRCSHVRALKED